MTALGNQTVGMNATILPSPLQPCPGPLLFCWPTPPLSNAMATLPVEPLWFRQGKLTPLLPGPREELTGRSGKATYSQEPWAVGMRDTLLPPQYMPRILRRADHGILEQPVPNLSLCRQWPCATKDAVEEDRAERCREKQVSMQASLWSTLVEPSIA